MKENSAKSKLIKRIMGIAIPAMVLIITIIMVSVSFAWFSTESKPKMETVRLTTKRAFMLTFTAESDSGSRNINFKGQTAIDGNGRLVTDNNGRVYSSLSGAGLEQYMRDAPYYFLTTISLDTESKYVDMSMLLDTAEITSGDSRLNIYDSIGNGFASEDMPYAFTWYFKAHDDNSVNYLGSVVGEDDRRVMDYKLPSDNEVWYTPYGKLTFDQDHLIKAVNDVSVNNTAVTDAADTEPRYSLLGEGLKEMLLLASNTSFDFYIVFAPQKLFWAQFCVADRDKTVNDIYTADEQVKIFGSSSTNQMYYSSMAYFGAVFTFGATLRVTNIYSDD